MPVFQHGGGAAGVDADGADSTVGVVDPTIWQRQSLFTEQGIRVTTGGRPSRPVTTMAQLVKANSNCSDGWHGPERSGEPSGAGGVLQIRQLKKGKKANTDLNRTMACALMPPDCADQLPISAWSLSLNIEVMARACVGYQRVDGEKHLAMVKAIQQKLKTIPLRAVSAELEQEWTRKRSEAIAAMSVEGSDEAKGTVDASSAAGRAGAMAGASHVESIPLAAGAGHPVLSRYTEKDCLYIGLGNCNGKTGKQLFLLDSLKFAEGRSRALAWCRSTSLADGLERVNRLWQRGCGCHWHCTVVHGDTLREEILSNVLSHYRLECDGVTAMLQTLALNADDVPWHDGERIHYKIDYRRIVCCSVFAAYFNVSTETVQKACQIQKRSREMLGHNQLHVVRYDLVRHVLQPDPGTDAPVKLQNVVIEEVNEMFSGVAPPCRDVVASTYRPNDIVTLGQAFLSYMTQVAKLELGSVRHGRRTAAVVRTRLRGRGVTNDDIDKYVFGAGGGYKTGHMGTSSLMASRHKTRRGDCDTNAADPCRGMDACRWLACIFPDKDKVVSSSPLANKVPSSTVPSSRRAASRVAQADVAVRIPTATAAALSRVPVDLTPLVGVQKEADVSGRACPGASETSPVAVLPQGRAAAHALVGTLGDAGKRHGATTAKVADCDDDAGHDTTIGSEPGRLVQRIGDTPCMPAIGGEGLVVQGRDLLGSTVDSLASTVSVDTVSGWRGDDTMEWPPRGVSPGHDGVTNGGDRCLYGEGANHGYWLTGSPTWGRLTTYDPQLLASPDSEGRRGSQGDYVVDEYPRDRVD